MTFKLNKDRVADLCKKISLLAQKGIESESLVGTEERPQLQKYDEFVPANLLRKAFVADSLSVRELIEEVRGWQLGENK